MFKPMKPMRLMCLVVTLVALSGPVHGAEQASNNLTLVRPTVSYKADVTIKAGRMTLSGTTWYTPKKERHELGFRPTRFRGKPTIYRRDKGLTWLLTPERKTYFRLPLGKATGGQGFVSSRAVEKVRLGSEKIGGIETTKYRVTFPPRKFGQAWGIIWMTKDNIVVRIKGQVTVKGRTSPFEFQLSKLEVGPQPDDLFEIPEGYKETRPTMGNPGVERQK